MISKSQKIKENKKRVKKTTPLFLKKPSKLGQIF
jgi:hypothetical protein